MIIEITQLDLIREPKLIAASRPYAYDRDDLVDDDGLSVEVVPGYARGARLACGNACPMLGPDSLCSIYPSRPNICVSFRAGSEQCQTARELAGLPELEPTKPAPRAPMKKGRTVVASSIGTVNLK